MRVPSFLADATDDGGQGNSHGQAILRQVELASITALLYAIQDPAFLLDPQGEVVAANEAATRRCGLHCSEMVGHCCFDIPIDPPPLRREELDEALRTKRSSRWEERSGDIFTESNLVPILDEVGGVRLVALFIRDVSRQRHEEERLRARERKYRLLAANFPDGMVILLDKELRILLIDGQATETLNVPNDRLIGRRFEDLLPASAQPVIGSIQEAILKGERSENDVPISGGTLHFLVIPIEQGEGPGAALVVARDVTKQRAQEWALRTSEERLKSVFDHALVGIYRTTPEGAILMANPALVRLLGFSSFEELAERDLKRDGFEVDTSRQVFLDKIDREGSVQDMYSKWRRKDGRIIHIRDSATAIKDENGKTIYYEGTIEDVTEKEAYKAKIEQLNQSLKVVNSILRHDIMNDLSVAIGSLDLYRKRGDSKLLDMADRSMRKCSDLIRKMKELESIISSEDLRVMSARDVVREVVSHYSSHAIDFQVDGDGLILADEAAIPALDNVIHNALTHAGTERVEIKVLKDEEGRMCEIRVSDHGKGVPDEIKDLVFQEGFRYGETGNTGLGLYIVRKTMERYGGEVRLIDNVPHGAVFILRFRTPGLKGEG